MKRLLALLILLPLMACSRPTQPPTPPSPQTPQSAPLVSAEASRDANPPAATPPAPAAQRPMRTGGPLPPERVGDRVSGEGKPDPHPAPVTIDPSCKTDADCTVKNVGNCCGYAPACVNVDSPTDPQGVQAQCAKDGMASVCGFEEISACSCVQGRCEAQSAGAVR